MSFLPEGYVAPDNSGYMKLVPGENTFRVLSSAIIGYEYWNTENKPVRSPKPFSATPDIRLDDNGNPSKIKHFWAFVVFNVEKQSIQILEITQASIQGAIKSIVDNKKWGDPKNYDITITKVGSGLDTEYSVMPNPHQDFPKDIIADYESRKIDLTALYRGENPFEATSTQEQAQSTPQTPKIDENRPSAADLMNKGIEMANGEEISVDDIGF